MLGIAVELWVAYHDLMNVTNSGNRNLMTFMKKQFFCLCTMYLDHFKPLLQTVERRQEIREKGKQKGPGTLRFMQIT